MANSIFERQNEQHFIDMLSAQRHLYNVAKRWNTVQICFCVIIVIIANFLKLFWPKNTIFLSVSYEEIIHWITIYGVLALLLQNCLASKVAAYKLLAAKIQQLFDCNLFQLQWNRALCDDKPQPEDISRNIGKEDVDKLHDWYSLEIQPLTEELAALVCMRTNVYYDYGIRKKYKIGVDFIIGAILLGSLVVFGIQNANLWDIVVNGIVPLLPVAKWLYDVHKQNSANLKSLEKLKSLLTSALDNAKKTKHVKKTVLEQIQNFIFLHRKSCFMIPSWVHYIFRNQSETDMNYSVKQLVQELL